MKKLYVKFFDVDWDFNQKEPIAKASLIKKDHFPKDFIITPTVFITNRTLIHLPKDKIADLADKIIQKVNELLIEVRERWYGATFE